MKLRASPKLIAALSAAVAVVVVPLVTTQEGVVNRGHLDPIGIVTSCAGHTGTGAVLGKTYTQAECEQQLTDDLLRHDEDMMACVRAPLNPYQHAAFLSFTFNVGGSRFCGSTLVKKLNRFDYAGACKELKRWTIAGGKEWPGLVNRREVEYQTCMRPYPSEAKS